jgi:hypothetical protein
MTPDELAITGEPLTGAVPGPERLADIVAIQNLALGYGAAVDDGDWQAWAQLFEPDARIDYSHSGGIIGDTAAAAQWLPDAMSLFTWSLHSILNHEIRFTGPDSAVGRVHLFNRNGLVWEGAEEMLDVGGLYLDEYRRVDNVWRFTARTERTLYVHGGAFAALVREMATTSAPDQRKPYG